MREVTGCLKGEGQVASSLTMSTDARLGYLVVAYQSHEILPGSCESDGSILVRLAKSCAMVHPGSKNDSARKAKVVYCPCCTRATPCCGAGALRGGEVLERKRPRVNLVEHKRTLGGTKIWGMSICEAVGMPSVTLRPAAFR